MLLPRFNLTMLMMVMTMVVVVVVVMVMMMMMMMVVGCGVNPRKSSPATREMGTSPSYLLLLDLDWT